MDLHNALAATPYQANRVLSLLHKAFAMALKVGWISANPVTNDIKRFDEPEREYWLEKSEPAQLWRALDECGDQQGANALRLIFATGCRCSEALHADWSEFDLPRQRWNRLSHRNKERKTEHVELNDAAMSVLRRMDAEFTQNKDHPSSGPLFPGRKDGTPRATLRSLWTKVRRAAGLPDECRIHDLRHSFASHLANKGVPLHVIGRLLGHCKPQTTARYAHVGDEAMRTATNVMGEFIESLTDQKPRLVKKA
jgi:integrase